MTYAVRHIRSNRVRRQVRDEVTSTNDSGLRYSISGYGENFRVYLEPNRRLLSSTFSVKVVRNGSEEEYSKLKGADCHHQGWITSHQGRSVAMSTCDGLVGFNIVHFNL